MIILPVLIVLAFLVFRYLTSCTLVEHEHHSGIGFIADKYVIPSHQHYFIPQPPYGDSFGGGFTRMPLIQVPAEYHLKIKLDNNPDPINTDDEHWYRQFQLGDRVKVDYCSVYNHKRCNFFRQPVPLFSHWQIKELTPIDKTLPV